MPGIGGIKKTLKIPDIKNLKEKVQEKPAPSPEPQVEVEVYDEKVTSEDLKLKWNEFAARVKSDGRDQLFILLNQEPKLKEDLSIEIKLGSSVQKITLEEHKTELLQYLRHSLKNNRLSITAQLMQDEEKNMIYTPQEKFDHLAKKHPLLLELKARLGLDPDY